MILLFFRIPIYLKKKFYYCVYTMKALFEIYPDSIPDTGSKLYCEIGEALLTLTIRDPDKKHFSGIGVYQLSADEELSQKDMKAILELPILKKSFSAVQLICASSESVLIPFSLYNKQSAASILDLVKGDLFSEKNIHTDIINEEGVYNVYRGGKAIELFESRFPELRITHIFTRLLRQLPRTNQQLFLILYPSSFIVVLMNEGKCDFINKLEYNTIHDVTYYLLDISKQLDCIDLPIVLSGLVDSDSALYKEIYKYFTNISFANLPEGCSLSEEIKNLPAHYFSHNFALYLCE